MYNYGRIHLDQWFTKDEDALNLAKDLLEEIPSLKGKKFIEPSAGGGAFMRALEALGESIEGYDLEPNAEGITQLDFLKDKVDCLGKVVIGNPHYGKRLSLVTKFVSRAFEQGADYVAFLTPLSIMRSPLLRIGRKVEYFKTCNPLFLDIEGKVLGAAQDMMVWIVFYKDKLQEAIPYYNTCRDYDDADSFWITGKEYSKEEIEITRTDFTGAHVGLFYGKPDGGTSDSGIHFKKNIPIDEPESYPLWLVNRRSANTFPTTAELLLTGSLLMAPSIRATWIFRQMKDRPSGRSFKQLLE